MSILPKLPNLPNSLGSHAASMAANARDGLRAAHYFVQELATADDPAGQGQQRKKPTWLLPADAPTSLITGFIAQNARIADKVMNWSSDAAAALLAPDWRVLPSPFNRNMMAEIAAAIGSQSFAANALFNAYFYRAALHILQRYGKPPFLVLENRIDAARRALASAEQPDASDIAFIARALIALVRAAPIAEAGEIDPKSVLAKTKDPNVSVAAVACVALLFGDQGKPTDEIDEDAFFAIVGALIAPRLAAIEQLIVRDDIRKLEAELASIKALY
ncbi:hypothetical protein [Dongia sedimenti]|uniref:Uncharacterized protein n=1 Tax=Dongia sedimenti TaxID=3064282 RepID=A0ABU0YM98_9PROT|nr:hypothetical protein [Rhodospirillaceae bacterium R-7]